MADWLTGQEMKVWFLRGCLLIPELCLHLALVKCMEQSEFIPATKTLAPMTLTRVAEHEWGEISRLPPHLPICQEEPRYGGSVANLPCYAS